MTTTTEPTFRRLDRGWVRFDFYSEPRSIMWLQGTVVAGCRWIMWLQGTVVAGCLVHVVDNHDLSPRYRHWDMSLYDPACSWCWLGFSHSTDSHNASTDSHNNAAVAANG